MLSFTTIDTYWYTIDYIKPHIPGYIGSTFIAFIAFIGPFFGAPRRLKEASKNWPNEATRASLLRLPLSSIMM